MAATCVLFSFFTLLLLFNALLFFNYASVNATQQLDCTPEYGCTDYSPEAAVGVKVDYLFNRKMLLEAQKKTYYDVELRDVPSGPDPLHHNGGSQKKPKISP
ncbi:unnamed protein product [Amaranthus hypochondriacus]